MFVGRRYRLYPSDKQARVMRQHLGACRVVFNLAVEQRGLAYRLTGSSPGYSRQCKDLKALRDDRSIAPWLSETPAQLLQQALRDADRAFQRFFSGRAGYPRFKAKSGENSFRDPQGVYVKRLSRRWGAVKIQGVGLIRFRWHRAPVGRIKHATVILESDGTWWVALSCEVRSRRRAPVRLPPVGVDLGVAVAAAFSTGEVFDVTPLRPKEAERLLRLERQCERQRTGSRNHQRTQRQIATIKARARRRRLHFAETLSHHLTKNHGMVAFEALDIRAMTRSAKGTVEHPGTHVRQKAGLNRGILDKGWGLLRARTREKAALRGGVVVLVNPAFTSQTCPACDNVDRESRVTRSLWMCTACGYTAHADVAAAQNILRRALTGGLVPGAAGGTPVAARLAYDTRNLQLFAVGAEPRSNEARKREEEQSKRVRGAA